MPLLSRISARALFTVGILVILLGMAGVALTHTQVGRDQVAGQIEDQFGKQFDGSIAIGRLTGNLLGRLNATDIVLRDPEGRVVLAADAMVLVPQWRSLLSNRLEIRSVELQGARLDLIRSENGAWNIASALHSRRTAREETGKGLDLDLAQIRIIDGAISTRDRGEVSAAVASGAVFDFANADLHSVNGRLRVSSGAAGLRLHLRSFDAHLAGPDVAVRSLRGRLSVTADGIAGDGVRLVLGESSAAGSFRSRPEGVHVDVTRSRLVGAEVRRLVPAAAIDGDATLHLSARGPLEALAVRDLTLTSGSSRLRGAGRVTGLPNTLGYDLEIREVDVRTADLRAALPGVLHPQADFGTMTGRFHARGAVDWSDGVSLRSDGDVDLRSAAGALRGQVALNASHGQLPRYLIQAQTSRLNLARVSGDAGLTTDMTGRIDVTGRGFRMADRDVRIGLTLEPSSFVGRSVAAFRTDLRATKGVVTGTATFNSSGVLTLEGSLDLAQRTVDLSVVADAFDIRSLSPGAPHTSLTGTAAVVAAGAGLDDLFADVSLSLHGASVVLADSTWLLPDRPLALALRPRGVDGPRLRLESEAFAIEGTGDFDWSDLLAAGSYWGARIAETAERDLTPRLNGRTRPAQADAAVAPDVAEQHFNLSFTALQPEALRPWISGMEEGSSVQLSGHLSGSALAADLAVRSGSIDIGELRLTGAQADAKVRASADGDLLDHLVLNTDAFASSLTVNGGKAMHTGLRLDYDPQHRVLAIHADAAQAADSISATFDARVAVRGDHYHLLGDLALDSPTQQWRIDGGDVDVFTDGFRFRTFDAYRPARDDDERPTLRLSGVASARAEDALNVQGHALPLFEILTLLGVDLPFDGLIAADMDVRGVLGQPAIVGSATVEEFSIWGDHAGRLVATSEIVSGSEGFDVDLLLMPSADDARIQNNGRLAGSLRLPGRKPDGSRDSGYFDLRVDLDRLDMFIFDHLFPDIVAGSHGGARGSGTITGDWSHPLFDAELHTDDARTRVPAFNLGLSAAGRVTVDGDGIHLHDVALRDKNGGTGSVSGGLLFNEYRFFSFDLEGRFDEFEIIDVDRARAGTLPFYGTIKASGSATMTGPMDNVFLRSPDAVTTADSRLFIPVTASGPAADAGFLVFTDGEGRVPDAEVRRNLIAERPDSERPFLEGLEMLLNVRAPYGSTVHLVFDPLIGDVINAVGSASLQLAISEGEFQTFGTFEVERGDYLFTAGEVFTRRFELDRGGTLVWDGDPIDARMNLPASYRTRASLAGLGLGVGEERQRVPFVVGLQVGGRVTAPLVDLSLEIDETAGRTIALAEPLRRRLNEPDRQAEYATSVLLTNTFLLAPSDRPLTEAADDLFFTSLSELVSTRLNLFLNQALGADNIDVAVGVQQGTGVNEFDLTYGVALRLLDERLIIRGEGIYHQLENAPVHEALQGEVVVEMRVSDAVSVEVFYRREGDLLTGSAVTGALTAAYGAGVNYQAEFASWRRLLEKVFATPIRSEDEDDARAELPPVAASGE